MMIEGADIRNATITEAQIANLAVTTAKIANLAVTEGKIADLAVTNAKIVDLDVGKLISGTIESKSITLAVASGGGDVKIQAGKTDFGQDSTAGFILGRDASDGNKAKFELSISASKFIKMTGEDIQIGRDTQLLGTDCYNNRTIFYHTYFDNLDGIYVENSSMGQNGYFRTNEYGLECHLDMGSGRYLFLQKVKVFTLIPGSFGKPRRLKGSFDFMLSPNHFWSFCSGYFVNTDRAGRHFGFSVENYQVFGTVANGTTESTLDLGVTISSTAEEKRTLECILVPGTVVYFYVDGVYKGQITTNVPTGDIPSPGNQWWSLLFRNLNDTYAQHFRCGEIFFIQEDP